MFMNERTNGRTSVLVELLSQLKNIWLLKIVISDILEMLDILDILDVPYILEILKLLRLYIGSHYSLSHKQYFHCYKHLKFVLGTPRQYDSGPSVRH